MNHADKVRRGREIALKHGVEMRDRYEAGASTQALADEYGVTNATVWRTIRANGGGMRGRNPGVRKGKQVVAERGAEIARDYMAGETLQVVADRYGVTLSTVAKVVRAHGGEVRKRGFGSNPDKFRGPGNPSWKGGTFIKDGYRQIWLAPSDPLHCMTTRGRYAPEHRIVMARTIKRPLDSTETVHHIDGDRLNNSIENLQLRTGQHGNGVHFRCHDCGSQNVGPVQL
jgi:uncharacterized protein (DUF433 family)